jgi:WD40 repeat protein
VQRIFLSHSSLDTRQALALKHWLVEQDPPLANEIFLDIDPQVGLRPGERWKDRLQQASTTCEAVVCLLSANWEASHECKVEYRVAETLNKQILCARLEPSAGDDLTAEWQRCDLFGDGPTTTIEVSGGSPVVFATDGLFRLRDAIRGTGISAHSFVWPPRGDPDRAPYRGWEPLEQVDAAVFFGRDAAIVRALDKLRGMRLTAAESLFVVLGPSGAGKSSFLRAGLLPRLVREDRRFILLGIVRPGRHALTGDTGLAAAIWEARTRLGLATPSLGEIKSACASDVARVRALLIEIQQIAAARLPTDDDQTDNPEPPTLILPLDQAEELFSADAGEQGPQLLQLIRSLTADTDGIAVDVITLATIRTDRYEVMQTHPDLAGVRTRVFDDLKPMPTTQFKELITGPAARASQAGHPLAIAPDLVERLLADAAEGADTLPMLSLTLARLYADYSSIGELTVAQYEAMGGIRRVVETEVDEVLAADPDQRRDQLDCLRSAFIPWLATINPDNDQPMRRVARYDDLPEPSRPLIDALVGKRLMVRDHRDGQVVFEVALESLLRQWDDLAEWLREERHELIVADDVERSAAAWHANAEDPAWLLTGTRLADAEKIIATATFTQRLNPVREYLDASRHAENQRLHAEEEQRRAELRHAQIHAADLRRRSRILRAVLAVTAVIAVGAIVAFGFAMNSHSQAQARFRQATSLRLASEASGMLANTREGSDARAFQQLLAANALSPGSFDDEMYTTVVKTFSTIKVIETGEKLFGTDLSPDGRRIVTGGANGTLRMWDAQTGEQLPLTFKGHSGVVDSVQFSPDGHRVASAGDDRTVRLWNADTGQEIGPPLTGHDDEVWSVAFSPDGHLLASGSKDSTVRLWNADTGQPVGYPLTGHTAPVELVTFSPDSRRLASVSYDKSLRLWDTETGAQIGQPFAAEGGIVMAVAFSPDGHRIASAGQDRVVRIWDADASTGHQLGVPLTGDEGTIDALAFSPDGRRIASGDSAGVVRLWDAQTGQPLGVGMTGHQSVVWRVIFSRDGNRLISGGADGLVRVWNLGSGQPFTGHSAGVLSVAFSPDGHRIASAGHDRTVRLWDAATGQPIGNPIVLDQPVSGVAFSSDGLRLATASIDGTLRLWDASDGSPVGAPIDTGLGPLTNVAFSPDGRRLLTGGGRIARVWDTRTGEPAGPPMPHDSLVQAVAFNTDGSRVATGTDNDTLSLWDAHTGKLVAQARGDDAEEIRALAFSSRGNVLATAGTEPTIRLWDADRLQPKGDPWEGGHQDTITGVAFSPDGRRLVSASRDRGVRVWDVATGHQIGQPLTGHAGDVTSVAFSPDGKFLVSGSADGTLRLWAAVASPNDLCHKLTANMSHKQWNEWVSPDIGYIKVCQDLPVPPS